MAALSRLSFIGYFHEYGAFFCFLCIYFIEKNLRGGREK